MGALSGRVIVAAVVVVALLSCGTLATCYMGSLTKVTSANGHENLCVVAGSAGIWRNNEGRKQRGRISRLFPERKHLDANNGRRRQLLFQITCTGMQDANGGLKKGSRPVRYNGQLLLLQLQRWTSGALRCETGPSQTDLRDILPPRSLRGCLQSHLIKA